LYFIVKKQQSKCIPLPVYDSIESLTRGAAGRKAGVTIPSFKDALKSTWVVFFKKLKVKSYKVKANIFFFVILANTVIH
jgi:DNA gyrase inhibitor GyrI